MNNHYPLTIFFDASCKLCNSEMRNIKLHDTEDRLILIDCSAPAFDDAPYRAEGITRDVMMNCIHAQNINGDWVKGVEAFEVIYRSVDMNVMAKLWGNKFTRPIADLAYPWVVRNRYLLSKIGLPALFNLWGRCSARKAHQRSQMCKEEQCLLTTERKSL